MITTGSNLNGSSLHGRWFRPTTASITCSKFTAVNALTRKKCLRCSSILFVLLLSIPSAVRLRNICLRGAQLRGRISRKSFGVVEHECVAAVLERQHHTHQRTTATTSSPTSLSPIALSPSRSPSRDHCATTAGRPELLWLFLSLPRCSRSLP